MHLYLQRANTVSISMSAPLLGDSDRSQKQEVGQQEVFKVTSSWNIFLNNTSVLLVDSLYPFLLAPLEGKTDSRVSRFTL